MNTYTFSRTGMGSGSHMNWGHPRSSVAVDNRDKPRAEANPVQYLYSPLLDGRARCQEADHNTQPGQVRPQFVLANLVLNMNCIS